MSAIILVYRQPDKSKSVQLSRALHGYTDYSNRGKYTYKRKGLLDKIPYHKVFNGVFILTEDNADAFIELLEKYDAEYYAGSIESTSADAEVLAETEE